MEKQNPLQNFDGTKSEILKKRLLKSVNTSVANISLQSNPQNNALLNTLRVSYKYFRIAYFGNI